MTAPVSPLAPYDPTYAATPAARRRRLPLWVKVVLALAGIAVTAATVFVAAVVISFSGGIDDVLDVRKPTEDSRSVVKARTSATQDAGPLHDDVTRDLVGDTGVRIAKDVCDVGEHNFKNDDPYDLDCVLSRGSVYAVEGSREVEQLKAALTAELGDWTPQQPSYYGTLRWTTGGPADGAAGVQEVTLTVMEAGRTPGSEVGLGYTAPGEDTGVTKAGRPYPVEALRIEHPGQLVVVTTSQRYFYD